MSTTEQYTINEINQFDETNFTNVLAPIYCKTPVIAKQTYEFKPFNNIDHLYESMLKTIYNMENHEKLNLIRQHLSLGNFTSTMPNLCRNDQTSIGLDSISSDQDHQLKQMNEQYQAKYNIPFIVCVRNCQSPEHILQILEHRLNQSTLEEELEQALKEINMIAKFRLHLIVKQ